jgi:pimeloyl-ACP methyl ester carboxylesterase
MAHAVVSGRKVYYEQHGNFGAPDARPLVLIMGMAGSCAGWLPLHVPELSRSRPVLIYDNRGVAGSDDPGDAFTTADLAQDTVGLLDALDIERADVLGVFMGGMVAQELALARPDRVDRLVLVGTWARPDRKRRLLLEHWADRARSGAPLSTLAVDRLLWTLEDETFEQADLMDAMMAFFDRDTLPFSSDLFLRQCQACLDHDAFARLGELENPCLILCGRHDLLTPPKLHRELASAIPKARLVTLGFGGHLVMVESAERFNQVVLQFLDDER